MKVRTKKKLTKAGWLLFYLYIILLSYFLFFSEHYGREYAISSYRFNLVPLKEIRRFIRYRELLGFESFMVNVFGNVLAFAPLGFMLPLLNKKYRKFFLVTFLSLLFSACVETLQLLLRVGIFDIDDIILNTVGGITGYLFFWICDLLIRFLRPKRKNHK